MPDAVSPRLSSANQRHLCGFPHLPPQPVSDTAVPTEAVETATFRRLPFCSANPIEPDGRLRMRPPLFSTETVSPPWHFGLRPAGRAEQASRYP